MNRNTGMNAGQVIGKLNSQQVVGLDIAKHMFQLQTVHIGTGAIIKVQIKRAKVLDTLRSKTPVLSQLRRVEALIAGHGSCTPWDTLCGCYTPGGQTVCQWQQDGCD